MVMHVHTVYVCSWWCTHTHTLTPSQNKQRRPPLKKRPFWKRGQLALITTWTPSTWTQRKRNRQRDLEWEDWGQGNQDFFMWVFNNMYTTGGGGSRSKLCSVNINFGFRKKTGSVPQMFVLFASLSTSHTVHIHVNVYTHSHTTCTCMCIYLLQWSEPLCQR